MTNDDFAWDVLADAAADAQMLYEPLAAARALLPDVPEAERQRIVERTLRSLRGAGLIAFVRGGEPATAAFGDPDRRLSDDEVDEVISGPDWRSVPVGQHGTKVWLAATDAGRRAYEDDAPAEVVARHSGDDAPAA